MRTKFFLLLAVFGLAGSAMLVTAARPAGGTITGKVTYTGTPPKMKPIDMSKEPVCARNSTIHQLRPRTWRQGRATRSKM